MKHEYLIALGSNLGDRGAHIASAIGAIEQRLGPVRAVSSTYETQPIGPADQLFFNAALLASSDQDPPQALATLLAIETALGRVRQERWGNRVIDLDLLLWRQSDDPRSMPSRAWQSPNLNLPHPAMLERDFVLRPACDIASDWIHPTTGQSLREALIALRAK